MSYSLKSVIFSEEIYSSKPESIIVLTKQWTEVSDSEKLLLEKILGLAQVTLNQIKIQTLEKLDILQWKEQPKVVLAFGLKAPGLSKNEIIEVQDVKLVVTDDLISLETASKEEKQKLAGAVKTLFA